jgi:exosortase
MKNRTRTAAYYASGRFRLALFVPGALYGARVSNAPTAIPAPTPSSGGEAARPGATVVKRPSPASGGSPWRDRILWARLGLVAAAFLWLFHHWIYVQYKHSSTAVEDWGHAFLVPFISGYLIYLRRDTLARVTPRESWLGLAPLVLGIATYFLFVASPLPGGHMVQGWAVILTLMGAALALLGRKVMYHLFLPLSYLVFAVTISERVMIQLTFKLQLIASQGAYLVLSIVGAISGFSVDVAGNRIELLTNAGRVIPLNVAEACSGMRMVVAFFALAAAMALISCRFWWQRVALVLLAAPVAILLNIGRVATLGVLSLGNQNLAQGEAHTFIGTLLLIPGLLLFMGIVWLLNRVVRAGENTGVTAERPAAAPAPARFLTPAFGAALAVMAVSSVSMQAAIRHFKWYLHKDAIYPQPIGGKQRVLRALPEETARWVREGKDQIQSPEEVDVLGTDNYLSRVYAEKSGESAKARRIEFHAAYYTGMVDTVPHVPERCLVGAGLSLVGGPWMVPLKLGHDDWRPIPAAENPTGAPVYTTRLSNEYSTAAPGMRVPLPFGVSPDSAPVLRVTEYADQAGHKAYFGYFFIANGELATSAEQVRLRAFDLHNDYAYYLKLQFGSPGATSPEELAAAAGDFLGDMMGELMTCVPNWIEVERGAWPPDNPKGKTGKARVP